MSRILKYTLHDHGTATVQLPRHARVVHIGEQHGALQLWALIEEALPLESRNFAVLYTGFDEVPTYGYIGTAMSPGGNIVRHVFEIITKEQG